MQIVKIFDIKFSNLKISDLTKKILKIKNKKIHISTLNAAKFFQCKNNKIMMNVLKKSDFITIDGVSFVFAGKILGDNKKINRVAGYDLMENMFKQAENTNNKFYFLGSKKSTVKKAVHNTKRKYKKINIAGYHDGYFWNNEKKLINKINSLKPDILLISITSPLQEEFIYKYKSHLKTKIILLLGGSFEVLSGRLKRAPLFLQKIGMEWFFRLAQEPRRLFLRYLTSNTKFILLVLIEFIKKKFNFITNN